MLVSFLLPAIAALGQSVSVTRVGSSAYQCVAVDGSHASNHATPHDAQETCTNAAMKHPGKEYRVKSSDLSVIGTAAANPVITGGGKGGESAPNIPSPPANTSAPTVPIQLDPVDGSGSITFRFYQSVGPHDGSNAHPGVANYDAECAGSVLNGLVDGTTFPITAPSANAQTGSFTFTNVGGNGTAGSATRVNTVDWDLVSPANAAGDGGFDGSTTHEMTLNSISYSAGQIVSAGITSFSSSDQTGPFPGEYAGAGIGVFGSTASNAAGVAVYQIVYPTTRDFYVFVRTAAGAARQDSVFNAGDGSLHDLLIVPVTASTTTAFQIYRIRSGEPELLHTTPTITLGGSPVAGMLTTGLTANQSTGRFDNFAVRTSTPVTFSRTTSGSMSCRMRARATTSGALSGWSNLLTGSGAGSAPSNYKKLYPGHYFTLDSLLFDDTYTSFTALADQVLGDPEVMGITAKITWKEIEPAENNYVAVTGIMRDLVDYVATNYPTKAVGFEIWYQRYGGSISSDYGDDHGTLPTWVHDQGRSRDKNCTAGVTYDMQSTANKNLLRDMFIAIAAEFDDPLDNPNNANFLGVWTTETADCHADYDGDVRIPLIITMLDELDDDYEHSMFTLMMNWIEIVGEATPDDGLDIMSALSTRCMGISGSDIEIPNSSAGENDGERIYQGRGVAQRYNYIGAPSTTGNFGSTDYRGTSPWMAAHDQFWTDVTRDEAWNYARDTLHPSVIRWVYLDSDPSGRGLAYSDIINKIQTSTGANDALTRTCPTSCGGTCIDSPEDVP